MPDHHRDPIGGHAPHAVASQATMRNAIVGDHLAALEAEAGIERLLRDIRDVEGDDHPRRSRGRRIRLAVGRALVALGNGIAAPAAAEDPCPDLHRDGLTAS
jgi:hypothetical protein